jgi:hypothetical protein
MSVADNRRLLADAPDPAALQGILADLVGIIGSKKRRKRD